MNNRLFYKFFVSSSIAIITSFFVIMILLSISVNSYFVREKEVVLLDNCKTISEVLSKETDNTENFYVSLNGVIRVVSNAVSGEAYVCDSKGNVFLCSCPEWENYNSCAHSKGIIDESILYKASKNGKYFEIGHLGSKLSKNYYTAATPFHAPDGSVAGYVFLSSPATLLNNMWSELSTIFILCAILPVILSFVFLYISTKRMTKPINLMAKAASHMSKGDFSARIPVSGYDEISDLAESFNKMSDSLSQLESMRRSFIANVSHELRTPITTIGGFIDGILDGTIPEDKHKHYLGIVSSEMKRLSRIVQSMLSLAKLESGEMKMRLVSFSPFDLVCEVLSTLEQRIEAKQLDIRGLDNTRNIRFVGDRDLMYQVIYNLTDNAIKFAADKGYIKFDISIKDDCCYYFKITNDGKGINPDELQYVFDRFYKTDKSRSSNKEGTGLGLYIVKTIVDIHKGTITVSSSPNEYTDFEIKLPANLSDKR